MLDFGQKCPCHLSVKPSEATTSWQGQFNRGGFRLSSGLLLRRGDLFEDHSLGESLARGLAGAAAR